MKYQSLKEQFPNINEIIAVSKTFNCEAIQEVYTNGFRHFGENKVQELLSKQSCNPNIIWHFIGHLQSNKVKDVIRVATWIDSVDSIKLIETLEKECKKVNKVINILIQIKLTDEISKSGINQNEITALIDECRKCNFVQCHGFMIIGPNTDNLDTIREVFHKAKKLLIDTQIKYPEIKELSMGMSHDYLLAYEEGSTQFRIGSAIFGKR